MENGVPLVEHSVYLRRDKMLLQMNEPHSSDCCCEECMPTPSYWNGIDPEWHRREIRRRNRSEWEAKQPTDMDYHYNDYEHLDND